jgi:hypothetical protein
MILFYLVNIPTVGDESSRKLKGMAVRKWDKRAADETNGAILPECALWAGRFSKTGHWHKYLFMRSMG